MMRAIHSPSKFSLVMTTMPRFRKYRDSGRMRPCQKLTMYGRPDAVTASMCSRPSTRSRSVRASKAMRGYPIAAMAATWTRFRRDCRQPGVSFTGVERPRARRSSCGRPRS